MDDADLLKPYLDQATEKLRWSAYKRTLSIKKVKDALRKALTAQGIVSIRVVPAYEPIFTQYLDSHEAFERISDEPEWVLKVMRSG